MMDGEIVTLTGGGSRLHMNRRYSAARCINEPDLVFGTVNTSTPTIDHHHRRHQYYHEISLSLASDSPRTRWQGYRRC